MHHSNKSHSKSFHTYHLIARCTVHGRLPLDENNFFHWYLQNLDYVTPTKIYTRKHIVIMETTTSDFHISLYILQIKNLAFHLPHIRILETSPWGNTSSESLKRYRTVQGYETQMLMHTGTCTPDVSLVREKKPDAYGTKIWTN